MVVVVIVIVKNNGDFFRVGIILDLASLTTRTAGPHGGAPTGIELAAAHRFVYRFYCSLLFFLLFYQCSRAVWPRRRSCRWGAQQQTGSPAGPIPSCYADSLYKGVLYQRYRERHLIGKVLFYH